MPQHRKSESPEASWRDMSDEDFNRTYQFSKTKVNKTLISVAIGLSGPPPAAKKDWKQMAQAVGGKGKGKDVQKDAKALIKLAQTDEDRRIAIIKANMKLTTGRNIHQTTAVKLSRKIYDYVYSKTGLAKSRRKVL